MTYLLFKAFWYLLAALGIGFFLGYRLRSADADELEERLRRDIADRDQRLAERMRSEPASSADAGTAGAASAPVKTPETTAEAAPTRVSPPASTPASTPQAGDPSTAQSQGVPFAAAAGATPDDLKRIKGVGPKLEAELNGLGITTFAQIAAFDDSDLERLDDALTAFKGRAVRDDWVGQATELAARP